MPCAVVCIPEGHQEKCAGQLNLLKKKNPGLKWAVLDKPLDAVTKANEMAESEPGKLCSLFIIHSKFFNITKDPFAATLFKAAQKGPTATFGCGKESGCDKPGKKFHWYLGPDGEWDVAAATKHINKLLDGQFTENGFHGKPLRTKQAAPSEISAMNMSSRSLSPTMSMGNGMGMMGSMGMGGGMGGMSGNTGGSPMGMSQGSLSSGTGASFGASGGMTGTMGGMSGQLGSGGMASTGSMRGSLGSPGGMAGGGMMSAGGDAGMGAMGSTGMAGGTMGGMAGGGMGMGGAGMSGGMAGGGMSGGMAGGGMSGGMAGGGMSGSMPGGGMSGGMSGGGMGAGMSGGGIGGMSGGAMGMSGGGMGGMSGGAMGMSGGGIGLGSGLPAPPVDVVSEAESMLSKGLPVSDVVKMLAAEVKRLTGIVEGKM